MPRSRYPGNDQNSVDWVVRTRGMRLSAIGVFHATLMLASAGAAIAQGSTGGTLGKTDQSLSETTTKTPPSDSSGTKQVSRGSGIAGRWSWKVVCPVGNWAGDFVVRPRSAHAFSGEFLTGQADQMLNGRFEGGQISFTRQFNNGGHVQSWKGTVNGARMVGSYTSTCSWGAQTMGD
jgi:hypothetical protein